MVHTRRFTWIAVACGVLAFILCFALLANIARQSREVAKEQGTLVEVVVVTQDVLMGTTLESDMLKLKNRPQGNLPAGTLAQVEEAVGRMVLVPLFKEEPLVESKLAGGAESRPSSSIPAGRVAFALKLPPERAVGGVVQAGDRIDVLSTGETETRVLLTDIGVIGVAGEFPFAQVETTEEAEQSSTRSSLIRSVMGEERVLILDLAQGDALQIAHAQENEIVSILLHSAQP